ncbi:MAG: DUF2262 domain-containing protein [Planctomycetota bacterium]|nr:DUF2262 domain-containing protein [Planctomycetota bacterium]
MLVLFLRPWLDADGVVQPEELRVQMPIKIAAKAHGRAAHEAIARAQRRLQGEAVALTITTAYPAGANSLETAETRAIRRVTVGNELLGVVRQQAVLREVRDRVLGKLVLERDFGWYSGWRRGYEVTVDTPNPDDERKVAQAIERARAIVLRIEADLRVIREAVVHELFDVCNEEWRAGERPVSRAAFVRRLTIQSIGVNVRRVTVLLGTNGLFADHVVEVRLSPKGKVREICLAG